MLPGLIENISKNIHESYPQKLFETGTIFSKEDPINETIHFAAVMAYKESNFSEMKAILQSILKTGFKLDSTTSTPQHTDELFTQGRFSDIFVDQRMIGHIGEVNSDVLNNFKIRTPVVCFEINLSGLIFD